MKDEYSFALCGVAVGLGAMAALCYTTLFILIALGVQMWDLEPWTSITGYALPISGAAGFFGGAAVWRYRIKPTQQV